MLNSFFLFVISNLNVSSCICLLDFFFPCRNESGAFMFNSNILSEYWKHKIVFQERACLFSRRNIFYTNICYAVESFPEMDACEFVEGTLLHLHDNISERTARHTHFGTVGGRFTAKLWIRPFCQIWLMVLPKTCFETRSAAVYKEQQRSESDRRSVPTALRQPANYSQTNTITSRSLWCN